jgi:hypothetical protein
MNRRHTAADPSTEAAEPEHTAAVVDLPSVPAPIRDDDEDDDDDPPIGEPFAVSNGCDLLQVTPGVPGVSPGIPGCFASVRCDCGQAFKVDLLSSGVKPCSGCGTPYSHVLLVAPCTSREIVGEFLDAVEGVDDGDDDDDQGDDDDDQGDDDQGA